MVVRGHAVAQPGVGGWVALEAVAELLRHAGVVLASVVDHRVGDPGGGVVDVGGEPLEGHQLVPAQATVTVPPVAAVAFTVPVARSVSVMVFGLVPVPFAPATPSMPLTAAAITALVAL